MTLMNYVDFALSVTHIIVPLFLAFQLWALRVMPGREAEHGDPPHLRWFRFALLLWALAAVVSVAMPRPRAMPEVPWEEWGLGFLVHPRLYSVWLSSANNACFLMGAYALTQACRERIERRYVDLAALGRRAALWLLAIDIVFSISAYAVGGGFDGWHYSIEWFGAFDALYSIGTAVVLTKVVWEVARREHRDLQRVSRTLQGFTVGVVLIAFMQPVLLVDPEQLVSEDIADAWYIISSAMMLTIDVLFVASLLLWEMGRHRVEEIVFRDRVAKVMASLDDASLRSELARSLDIQVDASAAAGSVHPAPEAPRGLAESPNQGVCGWIAVGQEGFIAWAQTQDELRVRLGNRRPFGIYYGVMPAPATGG